MSQNPTATPQILAVIPARYASTRFPGKPLAMIHGKPMIQHVWERACETEALARRIIATDDERIMDAVVAFGGDAQLTRADHPSGTDRLWEVAATLPQYDWVLNIQGDEPFVPPALLQTLIDGIQQHPEADILTLVTPIHELAHWHDPNIVKAVRAESGRALYFSRSPVPYDRDRELSGATEPIETGRSLGYRHLGLYLYRRSALETFTTLKPSPLETLEKLEQLRALEHELSIYALIVDKAPIGVDTIEDLVRIVETEIAGFPFA